MRGALNASVGYPTCAINVVLPLIMPPSSISIVRILPCQSGHEPRLTSRSTIERQAPDQADERGEFRLAKTRIAVAGAGYIGQAHMDVAQKSPTCTLSAVVDPAPAARGDRGEGRRAAVHVAGRAVREGPPGRRDPRHAEPAARGARVACIAARLPHAARKADCADRSRKARRLVTRAEAAGARLLIGHHRAHSPIMAQGESSGRSRRARQARRA